MPKSVMIFGATGTVGAYTSVYLKERGYTVYATGRRKADNGFFASLGIDYYPVDITVSTEFDTLPKQGVDAVIHAASLMPAVMSGYHPEQYIDNILHGSLNILEYSRKVNADRFVFMHSRADSNHLMGTINPIPADINRKFPPTGDHSIYVICKNAAVDLIEHYYHQYGFKRFVLRLPTIYAYHPNPFYYVNGQKKEIAYRKIIQHAANGEKIEIWGDKTRAKEIVYILDLCQVIEKAITADSSGGIFNVGRGIGVTLEEQILGIVNEFSPKSCRVEVVYKPEMPDARQFVHDISKTVSVLGYKPLFDYPKLLEHYHSELNANRFEKLWGRPEDYL